MAGSNAGCSCALAGDAGAATSAAAGSDAIAPFSSAASNSAPASWGAGIVAVALDCTPAAAGFPANAELAVKLTIDSREVKATGYRLFLFYP